MKAKLSIVVAVIIAATAVPAARGRGADRLELLQSEFAAAKARAEIRLERDYLEKLAALLSRSRAANDREETARIEAEMARIRAAIVSRGGTVPAASVPVQGSGTGHTAVTHVKNTRGWAGIPEFSKNNVYTFDLAGVGPRTTLTFYASGRSSTDTFGDVYLVTPDGRRERVYRWRPGDFEIPLKEARTYRHLRPITVDISSLVKSPGRYQVEFRYRGGDDPLGILRVEIRS